MFLDLTSWGDPNGHGGAWCHGCKLQIGEHEDIEEIRFEAGVAHSLEELNGAYHARCAKPLLSAKRAWDALSRFGG